MEVWGRISVHGGICVTGGRVSSRLPGVSARGKDRGDFDGRPHRWNEVSLRIRGEIAGGHQGGRAAGGSDSLYRRNPHARGHGRGRRFDDGRGQYPQARAGARQHQAHRGDDDGGVSPGHRTRPGARTALPSRVGGGTDARRSGGDPAASAASANRLASRGAISSAGRPRARGAGTLPASAPGGHRPFGRADRGSRAGRA